MTCRLLLHHAGVRDAPAPAGAPPVPCVASIVAAAGGRAARIAAALRRLALAVALLAGAGGAAAQNADYAREQRWADEVVPQLVVGEAVRLQAQGRSFLALHTTGAGGGSAGRPALLLVHGIGVHPDHGVIGELRTRLADAGYTTLSIQMPVLAKEVADGSAYAVTFEESAARIAAGERWLRGQGARRVVLVSHSLGSRMANVYFERTPGAPFGAWVCMGIGGRIGAMSDNRLPILELRGEQDLAAVRHPDSVAARRLTLTSHPGSLQREIAGADHHYAGRERELAAAIEGFLAGLAPGS
jgi:alpha/beta superfamily hydrolase